MKSVKSVLALIGLFLGLIAVAQANDTTPQQTEQPATVPAPQALMIEGIEMTSLSVKVGDAMVQQCWTSITDQMQLEQLVSKAGYRLATTDEAKQFVAVHQLTPKLPLHPLFVVKKADQPQSDKVASSEQSKNTSS